MNRRKLPIVFLALVLIATAALSLTTINGARAAISANSQEYVSEIDIKQLDLKINGDDLFKADLSKEPIGKITTKQITVSNTGTMNEYVRLVVNKYWTNEIAEDSAESALANKRLDLDSSKINLELQLGDGWKLYQKTDESQIIYYSPILGNANDVDDEGKILHASETSPVGIKLSVDDSIKKEYKVEESVTEEGVTKITYSYKYDGASYVIEIEADGVQTHNVVDAVVSAWGARGASLTGENLIIPEKD